MSIDLQQKIKISQNLIITPELQQSIKILQLSKLELEDFLQDQLTENPILEDKDEEEAVQEELSNTEEKTNTTEKETYLYEDLPIYKKNTDRDFSHLENSYTKSQNDYNYEEVVSKKINLKDHLLDQISFLKLKNEEKKRIFFLLDSLNDSGFLENSEETLNDGKYSKDELLKALKILQQLDPPGVGARSFEESLLIQLELRKEKTELLETLIRNHLKDLAKKNYKSICKKLKITLMTLQKNLSIISSLKAQPAEDYTQEFPQYITPDIYLEKIDSNWSISLEKIRHGNLGINSYYASLVSSTKGKKEEKQFLRGKIKEAKWLIRSLEQREKTLLRVVNAILEKQPLFFSDGKEHLKPMILKEIAEATNLHESTISRITNNKYIQTKHGLFELRSFFNSSLNSSKGSPVSSSVVKILLTQMIKEEDTKKPLSDLKLQEKLKEKGIDIARRTVTKYREQLGFLSSNRRIRYH